MFLNKNIEDKRIGIWVNLNINLVTIVCIMNKDIYKKNVIFYMDINDGGIIIVIG